MTIATFELRTSDGLRLAARRWAAATPAEACVVLVHGFSGSMADPGLTGLAEALATDGVDVLTYDARGHGASEGLCTLGDLERFDVAAAVAMARERHERVVVLGASMGGIAVLRHAATDPTLAGVVTVSSPARWELPRTARALLAAGITRTPVGRLVAARWLGARLARAWTWTDPPVALVARLSAPYAVVHGLDDRMIPPRAARELYTAARGPRHVQLVAGMGHAFTPGCAPAVREAVSWVLTQPAART